MKILFVHPLDLLYTPTTVRFLLHARALAARGHGITLVYFREPRRARDRPIRRIEDVPFPVVELDPFALPRNLLRLTRLARDHDLVHLEKSFAPAALPAITAALFAGKPLHYDWTDSETDYVRGVYRHPPWPWLAAVYERVLPRFADTVTVASRALERSPMLAGHPAVAFCPATVDTAAFTRDAAAGRDCRRALGIPDAAAVFLFLGGLEPGTYVDAILRGAAALRARPDAPDFRVLVVGGGTLLEPLRALAEKLGVAERALFTGLLPYDRLNAHVSAADFALAPYEDTAYVRSKSPVKVVEYLSFGLPVITNRTGDFEELAGEAGIYVDAPRPELLAAAMASAAALAPAPRARLSRIARERAVERYDFSRSGIILESAYARRRPN